MAEFSLPILKWVRRAHAIITGSISMGRKSGTTVGTGSFAAGDSVEASGPNSLAVGTNTVANHKSQHVFGEFNVADPSSAGATSQGTYAEIVGNGTDASHKSNARTLDWSGNERLKGDVYVGCGSDSSGGRKLEPFPAVTEVDNGKVLMVSGGLWSVVAMESMYRQFWNSATSVSVALSANGKVSLVLCAGSSYGTTGSIMDSTKGAIILVSNGEYGVIYKGSGITASVSNSTLTVTSSTTVKMAVVEL